MKKLIAIAACSALTMGAWSANAGDAPAGYQKTGETEYCLSLTRVQNIKALGNKQFLVKARGGDVWLNETNGKCSGAEKGYNRLQYTTPTNSLCKGQIVRVVDNTSDFTVGSCSLGRFVKLEKTDG